MKKYITRQRKELLDFLKQNADALFSATDIYLALQDKQISRSSIYRNLPVLESEGLIHRVVLSNSNEVYYQSIDSKVCQRSIHLNCIKCGKSQHLKPLAAVQLHDSALQENGFELDPTKTVIYGKCNNCQQ